jgi:peroxin-5
LFSSCFKTSLITSTPCPEKENKYLDPSLNQSLLQDAKDLLSQNGSLSEAGLLLEAAIQKGELGEGGYETWILLGETRNMDEREEAGMKALMEGVRRAEEAGASGDGMLVCCPLS